MGDIQSAVGSGSSVDLKSSEKTSSPEDVEFDQLSSDANTFIRLTGLETFGGEFAFVSQHSKQFKAAITKYHPKDGNCYRDADRSEGVAIRIGWLMRIAVFLVFALYSVCFMLIWPLAVQWLPDVRLEPMATLAGITVGASLVGLWIRHATLDKIEKNATKFANFILSELTMQHDRTTNAVQMSRTDQMMTPRWPKRSAGWIRIALWYGRRYEDLGRYVTAIAWRVVSRTRWALRAAVAATLCAAIVVELVSYICFQTPIAPLTIYGVGAVGFCLLYGKSDHWSKEFFAGIKNFDAQKRHIHDQIAEIVAADKKYYLGDKRIAPQEASTLLEEQETGSGPSGEA